MNKINYHLETIKVEGFEKLICEVVQESKVPERSLSDQIIVSYDRGNKKAVVYKKKLWDKWLPAREKYLIDTFEQVTKKQACKFESTEYGDVEVEFCHKMKVIPGKETLFTTKMVGRNNPQVTISQELNSIMTELIQHHAGEIYANPESLRSLVKTSMAKLGDNLGLEILTTLTLLTKIHVPKSQEISETKARVQPKNYNGYVNLNFELTLVPDGSPQKELLASQAFKQQEEFKTILVASLKSYISAQVTYNDLIQQINDKVRTDLIQHWNEDLSRANKAWKIGDVTLELPDAIPQHYRKDQLEVGATLNNAEILLKNTLTLNLENPEKFKLSRINDMEEWVKGKLQQATQSVVSNLTYAELIYQFRNLSNRICERFGQDTKDIGYQINSFLISDLLDATKLDVQLLIDEQDAMFTTQIKDIVRLSLTINGRIRDLNNDTWQSQLRPDSIPSEMIKTGVIKFLSDKIAAFSSDNFYDDFNSINFKRNIESTLKDYLKKTFNVDENVNINLLIGHTALTERLNTLSRGFKQVTLSFLDGEAEFRVYYQITGVDSHLFGAFAGNNFPDIEDELNRINESLEICLYEHINLQVERLKNGAKAAQYIKSKAEEAGIRWIKERFYLNIQIIQVKQVKNTFSNAGSHIWTQVWEDDMERIKERIYELKKKLFNAKDGLYTPEEIALWKKELEELMLQFIPTYNEPEAEPVTILLTEPKDIAHDA